MSVVNLFGKWWEKVGGNECVDVGELLGGEVIWNIGCVDKVSDFLWLIR
jgi:hypothetical protein